jgi:hypothetical protein
LDLVQVGATEAELAFDEVLQVKGSRARQGSGAASIFARMLVGSSPPSDV